MSAQNPKKHSRAGQLIRWVGGFAISILALWWILGDVHLPEVIDILKRADLSLLALAVGVTFSSYIIRSLRWPIFFRQNPPTLGDSFRCLIVGFFMNNLLPARIGELVRAHLGGRATNQSRSYVLATIAGERLADGLMISLLFGILFTLGSDAAEITRARKLYYVAYLFAGAGVATALILFLRHRLFGVLGKIRNIIPGHLSNYTLLRMQKFIEGLEPMLKPKVLVMATIWSLLVWSAELFVYYLVSQAFDNPLPIGHVALFLAAVNFSSLVPAAPGAIGVIEALATKALVIVGVKPEVALAMVISQHMIQILVVGFPGSFYFFLQMRGHVPASNEDMEFEGFDEVGAGRSESERDVEVKSAKDREWSEVEDAEKDVSIIIPAYNEEDRLPKTLRSVTEYFKKRGDNYEVLVVDDGSKDATPKVVQQFEDFAPAVRLLTYPENRGKGYAIRFGVLNAKGKYILYNDADGATPIEEIERLENAIKAGADIAIGSRAMFSRDTSVETVWYRKYLGRIFNGFVNLVVLPGVADTQCGFKIFARPVARYLFSRQKADRFSFDVEILFLARKAGYKIVEVPINWTNVPGSKVNLVKDSLHMGFDILKFRLRDLFGGYR